MSSSVQLIPLGDLVAPGETITYGVVKPGGDPPDGVLFIRGGDVKAGQVETGALRRISHDVSHQYRRTLLQGGELLVSLVGNPGEVAVVPPSLAGANIARQVGLVRLSPAVSTVFVKYYLMSRAGRLALGEQSLGSVQTVINLSDLKRVPVPIFPLSEQRAIAYMLSSLDDKIELNRRMDETLEAMAQAIFRDWFVDFGPVRRKLAGATDPVEIMGGVTTNPVNASELACLFPDVLDNGDLPVGWAPKRLDELATLARTTINPLSFPAECFEHYSLPAYDDGQEPVLVFGKTIKSNKTVVPAGSVLLSKLNPDIPRVWLPNPRAEMRQVASTEFLVFEARPGSGRGLLYFLFRDPAVRQTLEGMVTGTSKSHPRVSPPALLVSTLLFASDPCVAAFEKIAEPIIARCLALRAENRALAETRDYLLPRLMSGEVRVHDAAKDVAA